MAGEAGGGRTPNAGWRAPGWQELRAGGGLRGLPPPGAMAAGAGAGAGGPGAAVAAGPFWRQGSAEWDALHRGRLTTSAAAGALGFFEPRSARALRIPRRMVSPGRLRGAWARLGAGPALGEGAAALGPAEAEEVRAACRRALSAYVGAPPKGRGGGGGLSMEAEAEDAEVRRRSCEAARAGAMSVHCAFGQAQEPAALYSLKRQLGAGGHLSEVGLLPLDPGLLPESWGFGGADPGGGEEWPLPPIGASPDAVLVVERLASPGQPLGALEGALLQLCVGPSAVLAESNASGPPEEGRAPPSSSLGPRPRAGKKKKGGRGRSSPASQQPSAGGGAFVESSRFPCPLVGARPGTLAIPVEVKSRSPFREAARRGRGRRYDLWDVAPDDAVPVRDIPQLQLHALCAGAPGCVFLCHTVGQGAQAWFVRSDPVFQLQMLRLFSLLLQDFVRPGREPPEDLFFAARFRGALGGGGGGGGGGSGGGDYADFLRRARSCAARAVPLFRAAPAAFPGRERSPAFLPPAAAP